jgi:hypothetical protein
MARYRLSIYQPGRPPPVPEVLDQVCRDRHELNEQIKAAGPRVFTGKLHSLDTATAVRQRNGDILITYGPYLKGKEHIGGLPIEVLPFKDVPGY